MFYQFNVGNWVLRLMFDVDEEESFPTFYSACVLLICSLLLYVLSSRKSIEHDRFVLHWRGLSLAFFAMSVDEIAGMHEAVNTLIDISWTIPAFIAALALAAIYLPFLLHLPPITRNGFVLAGLVFICGAIGVEHVTDWYLVNGVMDSLGYNLLTAAEEGLEMFGVILFVNSLIKYMTPTSHLKLELEVHQ